jgi:hypothetical protein
MNPIQRLLAPRSSLFKLALALAALVLVLWAVGSSLASLWITPVVVLGFWIAMQTGRRYAHRRHGA